MWIKPGSWLWKLLSHNTYSCLSYYFFLCFVTTILFLVLLWDFCVSLLCVALWVLCCLNVKDFSWSQILPSVPAETHWWQHNGCWFNHAVFLSVFLGPTGVGLNELKKKLLISDPQHFGVTVPRESFWQCLENRDRYRTDCAVVVTHHASCTQTGVKL